MVECPLATPTIGFSKSVSVNPTARSMARLGERAMPAVMVLDRRFSGSVILSSLKLNIAVHNYSWLGNVSNSVDTESESELACINRSKLRNG